MTVNTQKHNIMGPMALQVLRKVHTVAGWDDAVANIMVLFTTTNTDIAFALDVEVIVFIIWPSLRLKQENYCRWIIFDHLCQVSLDIPEFARSSLFINAVR
jgi:hypothetical protein